MSGSSSSSPPHATEVSSSRRPQTVVRDKKLGSSSRQASCLAREDQRTVRPRVAPSKTGAFESQRAVPRQADPPRRSEVRPAPVRQLFDGFDRPDSDSLQRHRSWGKSPNSASTLSAPKRWILAPPRGSCGRCLSGVGEPRTFTFPSLPGGPRTNPGCRRGQRISPLADGGEHYRR
jgi:hypothetical protein